MTIMNQKQRCGRGFAILMAIVGVISLPRTSEAQVDYRVYGWETPMQGWLEPTLHTYLVPRSDQRYQHFGKDVRQQGLSAHSLETEYGLTDRATMAAYADFESVPNLGFHYTEARLNFRYRFSNAYQRIFNPALYVEYYMPRGKYDSANRLEVRMILEHDFNDLRLDLNPAVEKSIGSDTVTKVQAALHTGVYYRRFYAVQPGVELHDDFGPLGSSPGVSKQQHILFPSVNIRFANAFIWNIGVGFGLTSASDKLTLKSVLSYQFPTVRPSEQAQ